MKDLDLRRLRYFATVAEQGSFTAAAKALQMAQPPLSVAVRRLEAEIGCELFSRRTRRPVLTPAGRLLLTEARELLATSERTLHRVQDAIAGREGEIRLAVGAGGFSADISKRMRRLVRKQRGIRIRVTEPSDPAADVWLDQFRVGRVPAGALVLDTLGLAVAVPPKHRLAGRDAAGFPDLIGESILIHPASCRLACEVAGVELVQQSGVTPVLAETREPRALVSWGLGVAFCTSADRGLLDAVRVPLEGAERALVTALLPNPESRSAALPLLTEALQGDGPDDAPAKRSRDQGPPE